jgi:uncharacterized protein (DUF1501 family)
MYQSRRAFLRLERVAPQSAPPALALATDPVLHLLNRITWGPRPEEVAHAHTKRQAGLVFQTIATLEGLQATSYTPAPSAIYPDDDFGLGLKQVAQLIKAEVGLEVACVDLGGWDTHENQGTQGGVLERLLTRLGRGLHAFYTDVGERIDDISVVTMSEFGRCVQENGSRGTDHGHGNIMFLMGGGVAGGQVFTQWPTLAPVALDDGDLAITIDYRDVLAELVQQRLLNPALEEIFPGYSATPLGLLRPRG